MYYHIPALRAEDEGSASISHYDSVEGGFATTQSLRTTRLNSVGLHAALASTRRYWSLCESDLSDASTGIRSELMVAAQNWL